MLDTTYALPGLRRHLARVTEGAVQPGQVAELAIDVARRDAIRRNHTGTHMLHWALREVLGEHVKQAGSRVDPDRLRFDFSHYAAVTPEEIARIEALANHEVLVDHATRIVEVPMAEAQAMGAIAFFGDKYGDVVRVLEAGPSLELCGGTHVHATGEIGPIKVVSEGSIGSNLRRIEAVTGEHTLALLDRQEAALRQVAALLGTTPDGVVEGVEKRLAELSALRDELKAVRAQAATGPGRRAGRGRGRRCRRRRASTASRRATCASWPSPCASSPASGPRSSSACPTPAACRWPAPSPPTPGSRRARSSRTRRAPSAAAGAARVPSPRREARTRRPSTRRWPSPARPQGSGSRCACSAWIWAPSASAWPTSDRSGTLASPLVVLARSGDRRRDHEAIRKLVEDEEAEAVIVGLPLSLDGSVGRGRGGCHRRGRRDR